MSPFDVDSDGKVELPTAGETGDPLNMPEDREYTREQLIKHTLTHEIGHAIGMDHTAVDNCSMFQSSNDWVRDGYFSNDAKLKVKVHNTGTGGSL